MVSNVGNTPGNYTDDFMLKQYLAQQNGAAAQNIPVENSSLITMPGLPQSDTFQKSSGNNRGTVLAVGAGLGAAAANYFKYFNPVGKDGLFNKELLIAQNPELAKSFEELSNQNIAKKLLGSLKDGSNADDLTNLIKKNPKAFGITETEESKIADAVKNLINGKDKAGLIKEFENSTTSLKSTIKTMSKNATTELKTFFNEDMKTLTKEAPETIQKALKNVKWKQAGKWGAIALGVGLVLNWAFGGNKN